MERSAEWLRGAKWMALECGEPLAASKMSMLLAAAEAREAGEQCPHCDNTGTAISSNQAGDEYTMRCCCEHGKNRDKQPTAAEVIEAAEKACSYTGSDVDEATELNRAALSAIARWKEANGG